MRNILLDLGTHYGQGLREFISKFNVDSSWSVFTFEANPVTYKIFMDNYHKLTPYVIAYNKAITNYNGTITINIETPPNEGETGMGSSVIGLDIWNPWGGELRENFKTSAEVPCIDLSEFIKTNFTVDDNIVIKMDIEGAEYDTLEKMIADKTLDYVNNISIEWHSRFFTNREEILERETKIKTYMNEQNVTQGEWH
jgi:FkbM family methyltransferase